ncbi:MAG: SDR family oxidoreductase [Candidatus Dormibacteria bacterium]
MDLGLKGKRALVTAASKGLGRTIAELLLAEGCRVAICSSDDSRIQAAAAELRSNGGEVHAMAADIAQPDECAELVDWAVHTLGGLDILVNNAGGPPPGSFEATDEARWRHAFDALLMSCVRITRGALPALRDGGGAVVNLTSLTAKQPIDGLLLSNAFRPAIVGMAKTLSREVAPEVRVNNIATEHILTDRIRDIAAFRAQTSGRSLDDELRVWGEETVMRRFGTPEELARAAVFLASDAASYITGVTLAVDGGLDRGLF